MAIFFINKSESIYTYEYSKHMSRSLVYINTHAF